jgi:hypothetical protein
MKHAGPGRWEKTRPDCTYPDCTQNAYYADLEGQYPVWCEVHAEPDSVDVVNKPCAGINGRPGCGVSCIPTPRDIVCESCRPTNDRGRRELEVLAYMKADGLVWVSHDKRIPGGCTKHRPDFVFERPGFSVILEVDEDQHRQHTDACELKRMVEIFQAYEGTPLIFVRYNPDKYTTDGKKYPSSKARLVYLVTYLKGLLACPMPEVETNILVSYLYYDGYAGKPVTEIVDYDAYVAKIVDEHRMLAASAAHVEPAARAGTLRAESQALEASRSVKKPLAEKPSTKKQSVMDTAVTLPTKEPVTPTRSMVKKPAALPVITASSVVKKPTMTVTAKKPAPIAKKPAPIAKKPAPIAKKQATATTHVLERPTPSS